MKGLDGENREILLLGMREWSPPGDRRNTEVLGKMLVIGTKGKRWVPKFRIKH